LFFVFCSKHRQNNKQRQNKIHYTELFSVSNFLSVSNYECNDLSIGYSKICHMNTRDRRNLSLWILNTYEYNYFFHPG
jgi:hypothetical protein